MSDLVEYRALEKLCEIFGLLVQFGSSHSTIELDVTSIVWDNNLPISFVKDSTTDVYFVINR